jgi:hypothetical protein
VTIKACRCGQDSFSASFAYAIVEFDRKNSYFPNPGTFLEHVFLRTFNVHLQKVDRIYAVLAHQRIHCDRTDVRLVVLNNSKGSLWMGVGWLHANPSFHRPQGRVDGNDILVGEYIPQQRREVRRLGLNRKNHRHRIVES